MLIDCGRAVNIAKPENSGRILNNVGNLSAEEEKKGAYPWVLKKGAFCSWAQGY